MVYFSYRQTIEAYPTGGGSYTVASQNLGSFAGLPTASALMVDYAVVVAVGVSAGVGALVSALPSWQPHTLALCLAVLAVISILNLRGVPAGNDERRPRSSPDAAGIERTYKLRTRLMLMASSPMIAGKWRIVARFRIAEGERRKMNLL